MGRAAVFVRFAGCNLWSGLESQRATAACWFCDTDFVGVDGPGGGRFTNASDLADAVLRRWQADCGPGAAPYVVFTGGEPLLQLDPALIAACHDRRIEVAVETNGTLPCPDGIDWICVSPKPGSTLKQLRGDELKLVYPQEVRPEDVAHLDFRHFFLQPRDGTDRAAHTAAVVEYCKRHPRWRMSVQVHKMVGIP